MGSFNVACSVSDLSIHPGDGVAFFILIPNLYEFPGEGKIHKIEPTSNLIYSNCYFNPLSLPIFGTYDDYGCPVKIVRDVNVEMLEKFFGMEISSIIECITCGRDIYDSWPLTSRSFPSGSSGMGK